MPTDLRTVVNFRAPRLRTDVDQAYSIEDLRTRARRRLPRSLFDLMDGGSDDEVAIRRNREAFDTAALVPRVLVDVSHVETSTTVLGQSIDLPFILAPTGQTRAFHPDGEAAVARSAARAGTIYTLSTMGSTSIEDVAGATSGPKWFQLYVHRDRGLMKDLLERSRSAGYGALCLTTDVAVMGNRERDLKNGMAIPPVLGIRELADAARRVSWWWNFLRSDPPGMPNVRVQDSGSDKFRSQLRGLKGILDPAVTWADVEWMLSAWGGPFAIKGIQHPDDAAQAVRLGVGAIVVSNHGGRQLDQVAGTFSSLAPVVERVGADAQVILDGGIRRGTDVLKALAAGATCCMVGRPYLYGLAAGGERGVDRMFEILRTEITRALMLVGCTSVRGLSREHLRLLPQSLQPLGVAR
jgi:L-lactate dehydrogenase (cytochrome)